MPTTCSIECIRDDGDRRYLGVGQNGGVFRWLRRARLGRALVRLWLGASLCASAAVAAEPVWAAHAGPRGQAPLQRPSLQQVALSQATPEWLVFHPAKYPFDLSPREDRDDGSPPETVGAAHSDCATCGRTGARIETGSETQGAMRPQSIPAARAAALPPPSQPAAVTQLASTEPVPSRILVFVLEGVPRARTWCVVGAVLMLMRMMSAGCAATVFGLVGMSSFVVGAAEIAFDLTWQMQASMFGVTAVAAAVAGPLLGGGEAAPKLDSRGPETLVGRVFKLDKPIEDGIGMLVSGGIAWRLAAKQDWPAGGCIRVVRADGTLLVVDPVEC